MRVISVSLTKNTLCIIQGALPKIFTNSKTKYITKPQKFQLSKNFCETKVWNAKLCLCCWSKVVYLTQKLTQVETRNGNFNYQTCIRTTTTKVPYFYINSYDMLSFRSCKPFKLESCTKYEEESRLSQAPLFFSGNHPQ